MGCFNKTGFYSHLPITYGDEIVVFIFIDESKNYRRDDCPICVCDGGLTPIAPPFFGTYDDYGGVENVIDDANHKLFTDKFKMPLTEFMDILNDLNGITVKQLKSQIKDLKNDSSKKNEYHHETIEDYEQLLSLYKSLGLGNNSSMMMGMEHKSIYDKMIELGKNTYNESFFSKPISIEESFNKTSELINDISSLCGDTFDGLNPLTIGLDYKITLEIEKAIFKDINNVDKITDINKALSKCYHLFGSKVCLHDHVYASPIDYALYDKNKTDINVYREIFIDYAYFLFSFRKTKTIFDVSPYHSQTINYETLIPLYTKMLEIVKNKAKNIE